MNSGGTVAGMWKIRGHLPEGRPEHVSVASLVELAEDGWRADNELVSVEVKYCAVGGFEILHGSYFVTVLHKEEDRTLATSSSRCPNLIKKWVLEYMQRYEVSSCD